MRAALPTTLAFLLLAAGPLAGCIGGEDGAGMRDTKAAEPSSAGIRYEALDAYHADLPKTPDGKRDAPKTFDVPANASRLRITTTWYSAPPGVIVASSAGAGVDPLAWEQLAVIATGDQAELVRHTLDGVYCCVTARGPIGPKHQDGVSAVNVTELEFTTTGWGDVSVVSRIEVGFEANETEADELFEEAAPELKTDRPSFERFTSLRLAFPDTPDDPRPAPRAVAVPANATWVRVTTQFEGKAELVVTGGAVGGVTGDLPVVTGSHNGTVEFEHECPSGVSVRAGGGSAVGEPIESVFEWGSGWDEIVFETAGWGNVEASIQIEIARADPIDPEETSS